MKKNSDTPIVNVGQPRYLLVAQSLIAAIDNERYAVGDLLPTEIDLCRQFGISRYTVREALRRLSEMGLVARLQGIGTRVKAKSATSRYVQSLASLNDLTQYAQETSFQVGSEREIVAKGDMCELLHCKEGQRWLLFEGARYAKRARVPFVFTQVYIPPTYAGISKQINNQRVPIWSLIEKHFNERIVEVRQEIGAIPLPRKVSRILELPAHAVGLSMTRKYFGSNDRLLEVAVNVHPPLDRFRYSMSMRLEVPRGGAH